MSDVVTKRALKASLEKLLQQKPLSKITISELTDDCGVSRMTFYYHFQDIYHLVQWICMDEAEKILENKKEYKTWQNGFLQILKKMNENRTFILNVCNSVSREYLENFLFRVTYRLLIDVVNEKAAEKNINVADKNKFFIANFYKYAFVGLIIDWINDGMIEKPENIIKSLSTMIYGDFEDALKKFAQDTL